MGACGRPQEAASSTHGGVEEWHIIRPATLHAHGPAAAIDSIAGGGECGPLGACAALCISCGAGRVGGAIIGVMWAHTLGMLSATTPTIASTHAGYNQERLWASTRSNLVLQPFPQNPALNTDISLVLYESTVCVKSVSLPHRHRFRRLRQQGCFERTAVLY